MAALTNWAEQGRDVAHADELEWLIGQLGYRPDVVIQNREIEIDRCGGVNVSLIGEKAV